MRWRDLCFGRDESREACKNSLKQSLKVVEEEDDEEK